MGGCHGWLMVDMMVATAPPPLLRSQRSAKHSVVLWNVPLTHATEKITGSMSPLVRELMFVVLKPEVTQLVSEPWPQ